MDICATDDDELALRKGSDTCVAPDRRFSWWTAHYDEPTAII
jgi:hypothetical protein